MTPLDWARLEDEADERGLTLVGYYHSHPIRPQFPRFMTVTTLYPIFSI